MVCKFTVFIREIKLQSNLTKKKQKYYTVWFGNKIGVFSSWNECEKQIKGFAGAKYKSFDSEKEAQEALKGNWFDFISTKNKTVEPKKKSYLDLPLQQQPVKESICVDAACAGNPGKMEYRGVDLKTGLEIFKAGPYENGTNNIGEFLAIVHALALVKNYEIPIPIYSDSKIAIGWIKQKKCKTKLEEDRKNSALFEIIRRAEKWLNENTYKNPILKWETEIWGEIPADFGRK